MDLKEYVPSFSKKKDNKIQGEPIIIGLKCKTTHENKKGIREACTNDDISD